MSSWSTELYNQLTETLALTSSGNFEPVVVHTLVIRSEVLLVWTVAAVPTFDILLGFCVYPVTLRSLAVLDRLWTIIQSLASFVWMRDLLWRLFYRIVNSLIVSTRENTISNWTNRILKYFRHTGLIIWKEPSEFTRKPNMSYFTIENSHPIFAVGYVDCSSTPPAL